MPQAPAIKYFLASATIGSDAPRMTITTPVADREGDRVVPEGGDFKNFLKNPVLCYVHDYKQIPIGRVTSLEVQPGKGIDATWDWLKGDELADRVKNAWEQGCINASSIGFIPNESTPNAKGGNDITAWEMLELTLCPIPMNPTAVRAMKSLGFFGKTAPADTALVALRTKAVALKAAFTAKGYEFGQGLHAMGCVESLLSMESDEPEQAAIIRQAGQHLLTYLQAEYDECYPSTKDDDGGGVDQDAQLDEPMIPMDDDSKYPFVSATGLTGEAKIALVKGINAAVSTLRQKRGRRISAANEARLKNAHAHIKAAHDTVGEVLDCVKDETRPTIAGSGGGDDNEGGDADGMIALSFDDDDMVLDLGEDEPRLTLDVKGAADAFDVDPAALRAALAAVIRESLGKEVTAAMQVAVDRARGRVVV